MPTTKSKKHPKHPIRVWLHSHKPKTLAGWLWSFLAGAITLGGGWVLVKPIVHVDPYLRLNPDSPFSERFKVSNDGTFDINDVGFMCLIVDAESGDTKSQRILIADVLLTAHPDYAERSRHRAVQPSIAQLTKKLLPKPL
jgi:hypothetical protein